jgi:hypothetical protein
MVDVVSNSGVFIYEIYYREYGFRQSWRVASQSTCQRSMMLGNLTEIRHPTACRLSPKADNSRIASYSSSHGPF